MSLDLKTNFPQINLSLVKGRSCLIYTFDNFQLEAEHLMLYRNGEEVSLTPKQVETLLALVEKDGEIVSKEALMLRLWSDSAVEESNLIQNIHVLRKVLGETSTGKPMIETLRRRGYRFNGEVKLNANGSANAQVAATPLREVVADASRASEVTRRRKGLLRGVKFLLSGFAVGFVFLILLRALIIFGKMLSHVESSSPTRAASSTMDMAADLIVMVFIPVGIGWFTGIGLVLFGVGRIIYACFEREKSRIRSVMVERVMAAVVILLLLSIGIPNLLYSYREGNRRRQLNQALTGKKSVAVLPLKSIGGTASEEAFEYGIAESVKAKINAVNGFNARSLSTSVQRRYAELEQDAFAAGRDLEVEYVLKSTYQVEAGQIKVTSQLLNVATEGVEDTFEVTTDSANVITAQDTIAGYVADKFLIRFGPYVARAPEEHGTNNQEAYRLYLQATNLSEERGVQNLMKARDYLAQAVELDPNYALAWAAKARIHVDIVGHTDTDQQANYQSSMEAINKARAIDPNLSDAYSALCQNKNRYEYDVDGADAACMRAVELDPNSPVARKTFAQFLYSRGRFDEAIAQIKTTMELQPVSYRNQQMYALTLYFARRYEEAEAQFKSLLELNPNHNFINGRLVVLMQEEGKEQEAFDYLIRQLTMENEPTEKIDRFKAAYRTSGWSGVLAERIRAAKKAGGTSHFQLACYYAKLGDKDNAFDELEKAYRQRSFQIAVLTVEPQLDSLHNDPRFADLVRRVEGH